MNTQYGWAARFALRKMRLAVARRYASIGMAVCALLAPLLAPADGAAKVIGRQGTPPDAVELMQLPQYCLQQYNQNKPEFQTPQFSIKTQFPNCGGGTNHYCSGILAINRANRPGADRDHRSYWITVARDEFDYTARAIQPYPSCGLREPLGAYLKRLEVMSRTLR